MLDEFRAKFLKGKNTVKDLLETEIIREVSEPKHKLSPEMETKINKKIANLSKHSAASSAVTTALKESLTQWEKQPESNSLVVLASPVSKLTDIFSESVDACAENLQIQNLKIATRIHDFSKLENQLSANFKKEQTLEKATKEKAEEGQSLIVIPRLDWCFLRCIGGLEAIERLRDLIYADPSRFWLIGCNNWAWKYLDFVYQVSAYFGDTFSLGALNGSEMKEWLEPVIAETDVDWEGKNKQDYFDNLANVSLGIDTVGADLWLRSLYEFSSETEEKTLSALKIQKAKLPDLPDLSPEDRYILYSLLLHGGMSLYHLALSLGQSQSLVKTRLQFLLQTEVITRDRNLIFVDPGHYPRLKTMLGNNNFLVGE